MTSVLGHTDITGILATAAHPVNPQLGRRRHLVQAVSTRTRVLHVSEGS